jgi:hypothetical protein
VAIIKMVLQKLEVQVGSPISRSGSVRQVRGDPARTRRHSRCTRLPKSGPRMGLLLATAWLGVAQKCEIADAETALSGPRGSWRSWTECFRQPVLSQKSTGSRQEEERYHLTGRKEDFMSTEKSRKCAHIPCVCTTSQGEKYCSQPCKDAGSGEEEIACPCGHPACATKASAATTRR